MPLICVATSLPDRARGCILGGAIGDAMGGPYEGQPGPLQLREHKDWKISDDTQLTLATCESIVEFAKVSPEHIAERFVQWFRDRRITGMGSSTLKALRDSMPALTGLWPVPKGKCQLGMARQCALLRSHSISIPRLRKIVRRFGTFAELLTTTKSGYVVESVPLALYAARSISA